MEQKESCRFVYGKQKVIFKAGDPGDCLYEIVRGKVGVLELRRKNF